MIALQQSLITNNAENRQLDLRLSSKVAQDKWPSLKKHMSDGLKSFGAHLISATERRNYGHPSHERKTRPNLALNSLPPSKYKLESNESAFWHYLGGLIVADGHIKSKYKRVVSITISGSRSRLIHLLNIGFTLNEPFNVAFSRSSKGIALTLQHKASLVFICDRLRSCGFVLLMQNEKLQKLSYGDENQRLSFTNKQQLQKLSDGDENQRLSFTNKDVMAFCAGFTEGDGEIVLVSCRQKRNQRLTHTISSSIKWAQKHDVVLIKMAHALNEINEQFTYSCYTKPNGKGVQVRFHQTSNVAWLSMPYIWFNGYVFFGLAVMRVISLFNICFDLKLRGSRSRKVSNHFKCTLASWSFERYVLITLLIMLRIRYDNPHSPRLISLMDQINQSLVLTESLILVDFVQNPLAFAKLCLHLKCTCAKCLKTYVTKLCARNALSTCAPLKTNQSLVKLIMQLFNVGFGPHSPECSSLTGKQITFYPKGWLKEGYKLPNRLKPLNAYDDLWMFTGGLNDLKLLKQMHLNDHRVFTLRNHFDH